MASVKYDHIVGRVSRRRNPPIYFRDKNSVSERIDKTNPPYTAETSVSNKSFSLIDAINFCFDELIIFRLRKKLFKIVL